MLSPRAFVSWAKHQDTITDSPLALKIRYENKLPAVDILVCTADPTIEPPLLVINTVFSVMAYDYPPEKLSIYLSDDGGSELTFYALVEAASFAKHWIPYCRKFNVEPRTPALYFSSVPDPLKSNYCNEYSAIKVNFTIWRLFTLHLWRSNHPIRI